MVVGVLSSIVYLLVMVVLIAIAAAFFLGIGTLLTLLFAVSVWEATVVVMAVTVAAWWFLPKSDSLHVDDIADEPPEEEWEPRIAVTDFVIRPNRRRRRRKQ